MIAINNEKKRKQILFISPHFKNKEKVIYALEKTGLFEAVVLLNDYYGSKKYKLVRKYRKVCFFGEAKKFCHNYSFSEFIFFPGSLIFASYFVKYIRRKSPDCSFAFGEDGLASYIRHAEYCLPNKRMKYFLKLMGGENNLRLYKTMYVMQPDLVVNEGNFLLKKIVRTDEIISKFNKLIENIFGMEKIPRSDILFLQQPFKSDLSSMNLLENLQDQALKYLSGQIPRLSAYIKIHPRTLNLDSFPKNLKLIESTGLFEASVTPQINNVLLITVCSTAAISPYMMWGYTPPICFLYKIDGGFSFSKNLQTFLEKFKGEYQKRGGIVYEPQSWNNFIKILETIN